jgi:hypothetical protein
MITFALSGFRTARARARRLWWWACRHPKTAMLLALVLCWLISAILAVPAAYADGSANSSAPPYMPPSDLKDSNGVPLWRYTILPLDRGDVWHPQKTAISWVIDLLWTINLASFSWCLWLLSFLLEFTWVDWIATPVGAIADTIQSVLSQFGWAPVALAVAGLVFGCAVAFGKFAKGAVDLGVSVLCFVLATGALANPVAALTGEHGALTWAESTGANLSVSVLSTDGADPTGTPDKDQAKDLISQSLMGGLIDVFVRIPAQEIAFGHALSGECDTTFTQQMKNASAFDSSSTNVRDAVGKCDKDAQEYVTHPSTSQILTTLSIQGGSGTLLLIALAMALITMVAVIYALMNASKLMVNVYAAMLPGVAREALWRSWVGMYVGAFSLAVSIVMLAAYLKILGSVMKAVSDAGLSIVAQTTIIDIFVIALIITLFWAFLAARRSGKNLAKWLATLGNRVGSGQRQPLSPIKAEALRTAGRYAANRLSRPRPKPELPAAPAPSSLDAGHLTATPSARRPGSAVSTAVRSAATAGQLVAAASTGGTSAVAMKAMQIGGKKVLQRQALSTMPSVAGKVLDRKVAHGRVAQTPGLTSSASIPGPRPVSTPASGAVPFGRQIVVDPSGVGRIAPASTDSSGVYRITRARPAQVAQSPVRAALERAAQAAQTGASV